jgi:hypothetical protein
MRLLLLRVQRTTASASLSLLSWQQHVAEDAVLLVEHEDSHRRVALVVHVDRLRLLAQLDAGMALGVELENGLDGRGAGARGEQQDARPHDGPKSVAEDSPHGRLLVGWMS